MDAIWTSSEEGDPYSDKFNFSGDTSKLYFGQLTTIWVRAPLCEVIWKTALVLLIVLVGLCGNCAVIFLVLRQPAIRRLPVNIFIVNLAIADFLTTLFTPVLSLICNIYQNYELGAVMCKLEILIKMMCILASIFSMIAISFNRFQHISTASNPRRCSSLTTLAVIILIWILAILLALPLAIWRQYHQRQWKDYLEKWCADEPALYSKRYWIFMMTPLIYIPLLTMLVVYLLMINIIDRFIHKLETESGSCSSNSLTFSSAGTLSTVQSVSGALLDPSSPAPEQSPPQHQYTRSEVSTLVKQSNTPGPNTHQLQMFQLEGPFQQLPLPQSQSQHIHHNKDNKCQVAGCDDSGASNPATVNGAQSQSPSQSQSQSQRQPHLINAHKHKRSIMLTILVYCAITISFWLPLQVLVYYRAFKANNVQMPVWYDSTKFAAQLICSVNSAINPFITFRRTFAQIYQQYKADRRLHKQRKQRLKQQRIHKLRNNSNPIETSVDQQFPPPIIDDQDNPEPQPINLNTDGSVPKDDGTSAVAMVDPLVENQPNPNGDRNMTETARGQAKPKRILSLRNAPVDLTQSPENNNNIATSPNEVRTISTAHLTKKVLMKYTPEIFVAPLN